MAFNQAVRDRDFSKFYEQHMSSGFQRQSTLQEFAGWARAYIDAKMDISDIGAGYSPTFQKWPVVDANGFMETTGEFVTRAQTVGFEITYVREGQEWKIARFWVKLGAAKKASKETRQQPDYRALIIGDWKGARHVNRFSADGSFSMANPGDPVYPLGTWRIEGDKLIRKFKDQAESADTIVTLNKKQLVVRDAKGVTYRSTRVSQ